MNVDLVSVTKPEMKGIKNSEDLVAFCARVSNPSNQMNIETAPKLLKFLIKHKHWSPFELVDMCVEIKTSRGIAAQILRHRSFSFQEFCISGDSLITCIIPSNKLPYYIPIKKLFKRQKWKNYKNILVRVYDENKKEFTTSKIKEVFYTGKKPVYKITLSDGKEIKCTKEHKFYTSIGFQSLEDIVGLDTKHHAMTKKGYIGVNGIPCYQNYEWLKQSKQESINNKLGLKYISQKANCSYHTIRKWITKHKLNFTKKEVAICFPIWNKDKFGYKTNLIVSEKHKEAIRKARSKEKCNFWKGGCDRSERLKIADWCQKIRKQKLQEFNYKCNICESNSKLELDHVIPVYKDKTKAYNYDNIQVLCSNCHDKKHNIAGDAKQYRELSKGNTLSVKYILIDKIEYIGEEETYDIEVEHNSHNYIANKILVHNSQRYSIANEFEDIEVRLQGDKNRQVGENLMPTNTDAYDKVNELLVESLSLSQHCYDTMIENGVAKEVARMILPLTTQTTMYMKGSLRSWIHYIELRTQQNTQKEHRVIADKCKKIFIKEFPVISEALEWIK